MEGDAGRLSMMRLTCFMAFFPATYVLVTSPSENMMLYYLGAFISGYIGGKAGDAWTSSAEAKASKQGPDTTIKTGNINVGKE